MNNKSKLPTEQPAIGGWFWNEKKQRSEFLMPPYPGVDDCILINGKWAYRSLVERDQKNNADRRSSSLSE